MMLHATCSANEICKQRAGMRHQRSLNLPAVPFLYVHQPFLTNSAKYLKYIFLNMIICQQINISSLLSSLSVNISLCEVILPDTVAITKGGNARGSRPPRLPAFSFFLPL